MRKLIQFAVALTVVVGLATFMGPAEAACTNARIVASTPTGYVFTPGNQFYPNCGGPSPGAGTYPCGGETTYYINGWFWSFGGGNPIEGLGNDNGSLKGQYGSTWLFVGYYPGSTGGGIGTFMGGPLAHWQATGTDGCIDFDGSNGSLADPQQCNVVVLEDFTGPNGAYGVFAKNPDANQNYVYNSSFGFPDALLLAPTPKPQFLGSNNLGDGTVQVNVTVNCGPLTPANGYYLQCPNTPNFPGTLQAGYRLYGVAVPSGDKPVCADSRIVAPGGTGVWPCSGSKQWQPLTGPVPCGQPSNLIVPCAPSQDLYLCTTLLFGGNAVGAAPWEMKYCSMNSSPVECDPNTADPKPKPGLGTRPDRKVSRGTR
jgi:hypothetical protein